MDFAEVEVLSDEGEGIIGPEYGSDEVALIVGVEEESGLHQEAAVGTLSQHQQNNEG